MSRAERQTYVGPPTSPERWEENCARWEEEHERIGRAYLVEGFGHLIEGIDGEEDLRPFRVDSAVLDDAPEHVSKVFKPAMTRTSGEIGFSTLSGSDGSKTVRAILTTGNDVVTYNVIMPANSFIETEVHQRHGSVELSRSVKKWFSDLELVRAMNWLLRYHERIEQQPPAPQPLDAA